MKTYNFSVVLLITGLQHPDLPSAIKAADDWATAIADKENCVLLDVEVMEDGTEDNAHS